MSPGAQFDPDTFMASRSRPAVGATFDPDTFMAGRAEANAKPEQSFSAALQEFWRKMNPVTMAQGVAGAVQHPYEFLKSYGATQEKIQADAEAAFKRGDYGQAARHALSLVLNMMPGVGSALEEAEKKMEQGDYAGGLADTAALGTQITIGAKAPAIARAVPPLARATGAGISAVAPDVAAGAAKIAAGEAMRVIPGMEWPGRIALGYPGIRQLSRAVPKFGKAFSESLAGKIQAAGEASAPEVESVGAAAAAKTPGQLLAESDGKNWNQLGGQTKATYEQIARAQANVAEQATSTSTSTSTPVPTSPTPPTPVPTPSYPSTSIQPGGRPLRPPLAPASPAEGPAVNQPEPAQPAEASTPSPAPARQAPQPSKPEFGANGEKYNSQGNPVYEVPTSRFGPKDYLGGEEPQVVAQYRKLLQQGSPAPPIEGVMVPNGDINIVDGYHRLAAAKAAGYPTVRTFLANERDLTAAERASLEPATTPTVDVATSNPAPFRQRTLSQTEAAMAQKQPPIAQQAAEARSTYTATGEPKSPAARATEITAYNTAQKAQRYAEAIDQFNRKFPDNRFTADDLRVANGADRANLSVMLQRAGLLDPKETPPDSSFGLMLKELQKIEKANASRATIKPPSGFSMGAMKNYFAH